MYPGTEKDSSSVHHKVDMADEAFDQLKAELTCTFAAQDSSYHPMTAAEIIARNRLAPIKWMSLALHSAIPWG